MSHHNKRYQHTLDFLHEVLPAPATILDLGTRNDFSEIMESHGYTVINTEGEDLDLLPEVVKKYNVDAVTAFVMFATAAAAPTQGSRAARAPFVLLLVAF